MKRFFSDLGNELLNTKIKFYEKIAGDYFHMSVVYLDELDFKGSFNAIAEANMPLSKFEELLHTQDVADFLTLSEFLKSMKDDLYKNKCISQCMQSRFVADLLLNEIIENPTAQCARKSNFLQKGNIFLQQAYFHLKTTLSNLKLHEKSLNHILI